MKRLPRKARAARVAEMQAEDQVGRVIARTQALIAVAGESLGLSPEQMARARSGEGEVADMIGVRLLDVLEQMHGHLTDEGVRGRAELERRRGPEFIARVRATGIPAREAVHVAKKKLSALASIVLLTLGLLWPSAANAASRVPALSSHKIQRGNRRRARRREYHGAALVGGKWPASRRKVGRGGGGLYPEGLRPWIQLSASCDASGRPCTSRCGSRTGYAGARAQQCGRVVRSGLGLGSPMLSRRPHPGARSLLRDPPSRRNARALAPRRRLIPEARCFEGEESCPPKVKGSGGQPAKGDAAPMTEIELRGMRAENEVRMRWAAYNAARAARDLEAALSAFRKQCERVAAWTLKARIHGA